MLPQLFLCTDCAGLRSGCLRMLVLHLSHQLQHRGTLPPNAHNSTSARGPLQHPPLAVHHSKWCIILLTDVDLLLRVAVLRAGTGTTADKPIVQVLLPKHQGKVTRGAGLYRPDDDVQHVRRV